jgi:heterodisulfide reductase subunit C
LGFLVYLPFSKHLHIMLAFPNTYFAPLNSRGEMENMPDVMNEVKMMMGLTEMSAEEPGDELPEFGAKDVFGLSWKNILDSYTCTECGRCTDVCPANITGKKLSPRKIVMDIRDRADEVGKKIRAGEFTKDNYDDGKSLFDTISREELHACTTCNACVEACPVMISPLEPILKLRRYEILTESAGPSDWIPMFTSIENGGSPWQVADARDKWATDAKKDING